MPTYDIQCKTCKYVFEDLLGVDEPLPVCPKCQGETTKLIGAPPNLWMCFGSSKPWPYEVKPHGFSPSTEEDGGIRV